MAFKLKAQYLDMMMYWIKYGKYDKKKASILD